MNLPGWVQVVIALAAFSTACATLWKTVVNPIRKAGNRAEEMLPLLVVLTETFSDWPMALKVLREMASQFKTDSGSSLRDVVNRLEAMAASTARGAETLAIGVEAAKQLAQRDREEVTRLLVQIDRITVKVDAALEKVDTALVNQADMQHAAAVIAADLAMSHARADAVVGAPGEAADAAAQGGTG